MGRMSDREKREREKIRAELKARGIIQPDKKRLDRRKLSDAAHKELIDRDLYSFGLYLFWALGEMTRHRGRDGRLDKEAVGAAKAIMLAARRQDWEKEQSALGRCEFKVQEIYEAVKDIYDA